MEVNIKQIISLADLDIWTMCEKFQEKDKDGSED